MKFRREKIKEKIEDFSLFCEKSPDIFVVPFLIKSYKYLKLFLKK